jgi:hypothetical protein
MLVDFCSFLEGLVEVEAHKNVGLEPILFSEWCVHLHFSMFRHSPTDGRFHLRHRLFGYASDYDYQS